MGGGGGHSMGRRLLGGGISSGISLERGRGEGLLPTHYPTIRPAGAARTERVEGDATRKKEEEDLQAIPTSHQSSAGLEGGARRKEEEEDSFTSMRRSAALRRRSAIASLRRGRGGGDCDS